MKIIGLSGAPGAGKTTISKMIFSDENTRVIHLDYLLYKLKKVLKTNSINNRDGENIVVLNKDSIIAKLDKFPILKETVYDVSSLLALMLILKKIKRAERDGIEYLILEGVTLQEYINLSCLDYSVYIDVPENVREERLINRGNAINNVGVIPEKDNFDLIYSNDNGDLIDTVISLENIIGENISTSSKKSLVHSLENRIVVRDRRNRNNKDF